MRYYPDMNQVLLQIPETTPVALGLEDDKLGSALLLAAAVQWFGTGKLSSGAAAELAGISKPAFMEILSDFGVPAFRQSEKELREELENA